MDPHTCKLCFRRFPNGRALGGHMRSHVTSAGGTTKQPQPTTAHHPASAAHLLQQHSSSSSPSYSASPARQGQVTPIRPAPAPATAAKGSVATSPAAYVLRENPRKSYRMVESSAFDYCYYSATTTSSPFFADGNIGTRNATAYNNSLSAVVQDGESETDSSKAPASSSSRFRRSKRRRRYQLHSEAEEEYDDDGHQKPQRRKLKRMRASEPDQPVSSVSDTTPDEDVALCLMMLSRDVWTRVEGDGDGDYEDDDEPPLPEEEDGMMGSGRGRKLTMPQRKGGARARFRCGTCNKVFRSYQALGGHRASHKKPRTCSAAATPLVTPYTAAAADTPSVRRPTPSIVVDEHHSNDADHRRGQQYYHHQRRYNNNSHHIQRQHRIEEEEDDPDWGEAEADEPPNSRIHECPFCFRAFSSGQALGGHKRSHLIGGAAIRRNAVALTNDKKPAPVIKNNKTSQAAAASGYQLTVRAPSKLVDNFIDLNLPAPVDEGEEEEGSYVELSALSDAEM